MAAVLEAIGKADDAGFQFEAEALAAWEDYQLTGTHMTGDAVDALFEEALCRAKSATEKRRA
jgi:hypothetical protein